jgi:hypothetical protein
MPADRDLLFGLLALQNGLIDQIPLVAGFRAWSRDRSRPLAETFDLPRGIYGEVIALDALGTPKISRASHVEPDENGRWLVNPSPVGGPVLDSSRTDAPRRQRLQRPHHGSMQSRYAAYVGWKIRMRAAGRGSPSRPGCGAIGATVKASRDGTQDAWPADYNRPAFWYDPGSIASITLQDRPGRAGTYSRWTNGLDRWISTIPLGDPP